MAKLRDKIKLKNNELVPLSTSQNVKPETNEFSIQDNITDPTSQIRVIPFGAYATTESLVKVTQDLIYNDRLINNETSAAHSMLCDGIFNDPDSRFGLTLNYKLDLFNNIKYLELESGKIKTSGQVYQILNKTVMFFEDQEDLLGYEINDNYNVLKSIKEMNNSLKPFRRDYISVVYEDTSISKSGSTPYIKYVSGDNTSIPEAKHYQKFYNENYLHDLYPTNVLDSNGNQAIYKEYIIYSLLYYYNEEGTWEKIPEGLILPLSESTPVYPNDGCYFIKLETDGEQIPKKNTAEGWVTLLEAEKKTIDYFPPNYEDGTKVIKLTETIDTAQNGWYYKNTVNKFTELKSVDLIPTIAGLAELVNFEESELKVYGDPDTFEYLKPSIYERQFYHPYKTFKPLEFEYGQGKSVAIEGVGFDPESKFTTNSLSQNFSNFNDKFSSLFNFPFSLNKNQEETSLLAENVNLDHLLLGYKKEGFWNGDYVKDVDNKIYKVENNAWTLFEPKFSTSFVPKKEVDYDYLLINNITFYKYSEDTWIANTETGYTIHSMYPDAPNGTTIKNIIFIQPEEGNPENVIKGWYEYNVDFWEKIIVHKSNELIELSDFDDSFAVYCDGSETFQNGDEEGIYIFNKGDWKSVFYTTIEVDDFEDESLYPQEPFSNQYIKLKLSNDAIVSDEPTDLFKMFTNGSWIKINEDNIIENTSDGDFPFDPDSGSFVLDTENIVRLDADLEDSDFDINAPDLPIENIGDYIIYYSLDGSDEESEIVSSIYTWNSGGGIYEEYISSGLINVVNKLPNILDIMVDGTYYYHSEESSLYQLSKNASGGTYDDHGVYYKSLSTESGAPSFGWYKYDYFQQTWNKVFVKYGEEFPEYNLRDNLHFENTSAITTELYIYDMSNSYWKEILPYEEFPVSPENNDYVFVDNYLSTYQYGLYIYEDDNYIKNSITRVNGLSQLEDNFEIEIVEPKILSTSNEVSSVGLIYLESIDEDEGEYKLRIDVERGLLTQFKNEILTPPNVNDGVIITDGLGTYQIGYIHDYYEVADISDPENKTFTVKGIFSPIDINSKISFFKYDDYNIISTSQLTKNEVMNQIDAIDSFIPEANPSIDPFTFPKKFNEANNLYEIKFTLNAEEINRNQWYIIRTKSYKEDASFKTPQIIIANKDASNLLERNGYYKLRILTTEGKYPYYGTDFYGNVDKNKEYFVLKDYIEDTSLGDIEQFNDYRTDFLGGFGNYNILAKTLDDVSAKQLYTQLKVSPQQNNVYIDVYNGRIMVHPQIINEIKDGNYSIRLSHIFLNVLSGYIDTNLVIHEEENKPKKYLYDVLQDYKDSINSLILNQNNRKVFKYRSSAFKPVYLSNKKAVLLNNLGLEEINDAFTCFENGDEITSIRYMEAENHLPRLANADVLTKELHINSRGIFKVNDYFNLNGSLYQYSNDMWNELEFSNGVEFPVDPAPNDGSYFEITDIIGGEELGVYKCVYLDEPSEDDPIYEWVKLNDNQFAFSVKNNVLPDVYYNKVVKEFDSAGIGNTYLSFVADNDIKEHKAVGIRFNTIGSGWTSLTVQLKDFSDNIYASQSKTIEEISEVFNNTENTYNYIYFTLETDELISGNNYYYDIKLDGGYSVKPTLLAYYLSGETKVFFKNYCTYNAEEDSFPENNIFKIIHINSNELNKYYLTEEDEILSFVNSNNIPFVESNLYNMVIPVDFSDDVVWDKWNYANCIGVDIVTGRIKFPESLDIRQYTFEFNANWNIYSLNAKGINFSEKENVSIEDYFNIIQKTVDKTDFMNYVDERISRFSPTEDVFYLNGNPTQSFILSFTPAGYSVDIEGNLVYSDGDYLGSEAVKKSLLVRINNTILLPEDFEVQGREIILNNIEVKPGDIMVVKGAEYRVLTTVADKSITPDHFSYETQALIQDLLKIKNIHFPNEVNNLKNELRVYVDYKFEEKYFPKENIFRVNSGNIEKYIAVDTWSDLGINNNVLTIDWNIKDELNVFLFINNVPQSTRSYEVINENQIHIFETLEEEDYIFVRGAELVPQYNPSDFIEPYEQIEDSFTEETYYIEADYPFPTKAYANMFINGLYNHDFTITNDSFIIKIFGNNNLLNDDNYNEIDYFNYGVEYYDSDELVESFESPTILDNKIYFVGELLSEKKMYYLEDKLVTLIEPVDSDLGSDETITDYKNLIAFNNTIFFEGTINDTDRYLCTISPEHLYIIDTIFDSEEGSDGLGDNVSMNNFSSPIIFNGTLYFEAELSGVKRLCKAEYLTAPEVANDITYTTFLESDVDNVFYGFRNPVIFDDKLFFEGQIEPEGDYSIYYLNDSGNVSQILTYAEYYSSGFNNPTVFNGKVIFEATNIVSGTSTFALTLANEVIFFNEDEFKNPIVNGVNLFFENALGVIKYFDGDEIPYDLENYGVAYDYGFINPIVFNEFTVFQAYSTESSEDLQLFKINLNLEIEQIDYMINQSDFIKFNDSCIYFNGDFNSLEKILKVDHNMMVSINSDLFKEIKLEDLSVLKSEDVLGILIDAINNEFIANGINNYIVAKEGRSTNSIMFESLTADTIEIRDKLVEEYESDEDELESLASLLIMGKTLYEKPEYKTTFILTNPVNIGDVVVIKSSLGRSQQIINDTISKDNLTEELRVELGIND